ncbi:MAG TPA: hypothetical protein VGI14_19025 [Casimicrobiaceae bacterium]
MRLRMSMALVALLGAACANAPDRSAAAHRDPVYRTGSNIPVREDNLPSGVLTVRPDPVYTTNMPDPKPRPIMP